MFRARREKLRNTNVKLRFSICYQKKGCIFMIFAQHFAIYTVFCKESESEAKKQQCLHPGGKTKEIQIL